MQAASGFADKPMQRRRTSRLKRRTSAADLALCTALTGTLGEKPRGFAAGTGAEVGAGADAVGSAGDAAAASCTEDALSSA